MADRWIRMFRYNPLPTSEYAEPTTHHEGKYWTWLFTRRMRITAAIGAGLLILFSLSFLVDTSNGSAVSETKETSVTVPYTPPTPSSSQEPAKITPQTSGSSIDVNWKDFAYVQYVTNGNYLCNSLMILEALHRTGAKADRLMMFPEDWKIPDANADAPDLGADSRLIAKARDSYGAKLVPIKVQTRSEGDATWKDSYTKLLAFNQTQYKRVLSLDSDATVRMHMDELFLSPSSPVAMPRAYWLDQPFLSSQMVLVEPSHHEWARVETIMHGENPGFDMDILNTMYKDSCLVLPHRPYNLLSGEFRGKEHAKYLGSEETWNGTVAFEEAKFIHFSDWPVPKPWLKASDALIEEHQPDCASSRNGGKPDCTDRNIWLGLYKDFSERREKVCGRNYDKRRRRWTHTI